MAKGPAMYYVERAALNLADVVCVEGEFLKDRLLHYHRFARRKMLIISPPIDILRFRPRADVRDTVRGEMGLSGTTQLILGVGRLDANKNFVTLVRAASQLTPGGWRMAIAGTGREEQRLRTLIKGCSLSDCVELLGHRDNIEALYAGADIFAHPTVLDSYGNTVLEAMASRLPCVVSNGPKVGIARELQDGTNAVLANPRKPAHWAACLERLIHDRALRQHLGANARTFCEKQPTVSQCIEMILDSVGLTRSDQRAEA
jgi:glycosyltransferase involved in cell wall biosynthesis